MTQRFWQLAVTAYGLFLIWLGTQVSGVLLMAVPILVYLIVSILHLPQESKITLNRTLSTSVIMQNVPIEVKITLEYEAAGVDMIQVQDPIPDKLERTQGQNTRLLNPSFPGPAVLEYSVQGARGRYTFADVSVVLSDHFGLLETHLSVPASAELQSLPEVANLGKIKLQPDQTIGFFGPIPARQSGMGLSFWGVRDYYPGDSPRRINWKLSTRRFETLLTNEFEQERIANIGLILDARQQTNLTINEHSLFEMSIYAAAGLAQSFLSDGHRLSLLTYGFGLDRVFPGVGKIQRERIMRSLAQVQVGSNYALESLNYLPTRLFPARSQLVIISPLGHRDYQAFVRIRQEGYPILLVSPNPVEFEKKAFQPGVEAQQALRLARIERNIQLQKLTRLGVRVIDWKVDQPLEQIINSSGIQLSINNRSLRWINP